MSCKSCNSPDNDLDNSDSYEAALLGLTEAVNGNSTDIAVVRRDISELNRKMDTLMKHLEVPYKPSAGFVKE